MSSISARDFGNYWWPEVYNRIIGAAVFLDDASAECLHWDGGLYNLYKGGAVVVKSLSPFEFSVKHKKAVFITQATAIQLQTIHEIIKNSNFIHCILISCVSLDVVYLELNEGKDVSDVVTAGKAPAEATKQLEAMLLEWIGKKQSAVEAVHIPIFAIPTTNLAFLTPPYCHVCPMFNGKLVPDTPNVDLYSLSSWERSNVRRLASGLNSFMECLNLKEDIYFMGAFSSLVAGVLENSPVCTARRKNCSNPASLIIIDRTLDLCGVTSHTMESVLDKIMTMLPRFPKHSNEVAVDMSSICEAKVVSHPDDVQLSPGCIFHAHDDACIQTFEHMINKSQKEVLIDLYNKLSKIDVQKSPGPKTLTKVTPQSIEKIITATKGKNDLVVAHAGLLQQSLAVVQMLKSPCRAQVDLLTGLEKQVLQSLAASRESTSVLHLITQLIKTRKGRGLSLVRLLALLVHVYSLVGTEVTFSKQHEDSLSEALSVALFEDHRILRNATGKIGPEECGQIAADVMGKLKDIGQMRKGLQRYTSVLKKAETGDSEEYRGVLHQLVDDIVERRPELPDLGHRNDGIKDLLRTGLNMLTIKPRLNKHPLDTPTIILFIVGGASADECASIIRRVAVSGVDNHLLVGTTRFLTPQDAMRDVLGI